MFVPITALWLPILLSAVLVFIASSIVHMVLPIHRGDYRPLPGEEKVADALRASGATPGRAYHFPFATHKNMNSPEMIEKFKRGPVGFVILRPSGAPGMGKFLAQWFIFCLMVGFITAYLTGRTRPPGSEYLEVFRVAGCVSFMAYGVGQLMDPIWKGQTWGVTVKHVIDGLVFALLTAGTFGWLWPK